MSEPTSYFEMAKAMVRANGEAYEMPVSPGARVNCETTDTQRLDWLDSEQGFIVLVGTSGKDQPSLVRIDIRSAIDSAMMRSP